MKIGVIGLGNMADAVIGGMLRQEIVNREDIIGSAATRQTVERMAQRYGIRATTDNKAVAEAAEVLILAVKPQFLETVITEIRESIAEKTLLITIAAGKTIDWYESAFGRAIRLVRCMPNTPALVGAGFTAVCVNENVTKEEQACALRLMGSLGETCVIPESRMDAFAAVAGCSPAYVFIDRKSVV